MGLRSTLKLGGYLGLRSVGLGLGGVPGILSPLAGGPTWTPEQITTLQWSDAADADTITEIAGDVAQWDDKSGNENHLTQSTGTNQPRTGVRTLNGLNILNYNGDFLEVASFPVPASGDIAIFAVSEVDVVTNNSDSMFSMDSSDNDFTFRAESSPFTGRINTTGIGNNVTLTDGPHEGPSIYNTNFDFTGLAKYNAFIDGTQRASNTNYSTKLNTPQSFKLMATRNGTSPLDGAVGEVILVEDVSEATRQLIEGYLAWKWGLQASLPYEHPFKNGAPLEDGTASVPANWTPAEIVTSAWFDASDSDTITEVSGAVSQWDDKSGNDRHATEGTGTKQPITGIETVNGLNVIDFDGIDDRMVFGDIPCFGKSLHVMFKPDASVGTQQVLGGQNLNNQFRHDAGANIGYASADAVYTVNPSSSPNTIPPGSAGIGAMVLDNVSGRMGANGTYVAGTGAVQAFTTGDQFGQIAARGAAALGVNFFHGKYGEIVIYDGTDQAPLDKIDGYLAWKWGLQAELPNDHPYKHGSPKLQTPWTPSEIETEAWLDANDDSTITHVAGSVSQWDDKSGKGNHAVQAVGEDQPATGVETLGGLNTISTVQEGTAGTLMKMVNLDPSPDAMVFVAMNLWDGVFGQGPFSQIQGDGNELGLRFYRNNNFTLTANGDAGASLALTTLTTTDNPMILDLVLDASGSGTKEVFIDGVSEGSNGYVTGAADGLNIFRHSDQTCAVFLGELIVVDIDVSVSTRQKIEGYLAWKWGQHLKLPVGHPYEYERPYN